MAPEIANWAAPRGILVSLGTSWHELSRKLKTSLELFSIVKKEEKM